VTGMIEPAPVYLGLRRTFLETRHDDIPGLGAGDAIFGAMVESVADGIVVSIAVSAAGDASFYSSNGGGGIGGIKHAPIRDLAKRCLAAARELSVQTAPVDGLPSLPSADEFCLILMTVSGLRALRLNTADKIAPDSPIVQLSRLSGAVVQALLAARPRSA